MATQVAAPKAPQIQPAEQTAAPERRLLLDGLRELYAAKAAFVSAVFLLLLVLVALLAAWITPHDPQAMSLPNRALFPSWLEGGDPRFLLGTDGLGRDTLSRLIQASQMTLVVAGAARPTTSTASISPSSSRWSTTSTAAPASAASGPGWPPRGRPWTI